MEFLTHALIEHLAALQPPYAPTAWEGWRIAPVPSGNNLLFRAASSENDVVVKFLIRDERRRAEHEWAALKLLEDLSLPLGPKPIYCDLERTPHAVIVQTWLEGASIAKPPPDDATWQRIAQAYATLHSVPLTAIEAQGVALPQQQGGLPIERAGAELRAFGRRVPACPHSDALAQLLAHLDQTRLPTVPETQCWCHGDPNIRNLLDTPDGVKLVDWEYTACGDPAAEIARLMTHPFAQPNDDGRWKWVAQQYALLSGQPEMRQRIEVQYALRLVQWCIRLLVGHYVLLRQPTHRLAGPGAEAEVSTLANIEAYFERAHQWLNAL